MLGVAPSIYVGDPGENDVTSPSTVSSRNATKKQLKMNNKTMYDRKRFLSSKVGTQDNVIAERQGEVLDLKDNNKLLLLLEAATQARAQEH
jgi:hypothetical protein